MKKLIARFTIAASVLLALATPPARATDVPFSDMNIIDGNFDGTRSICGGDVGRNRGVVDGHGV